MYIENILYVNSNVIVYTSLHLPQQKKLALMRAFLFLYVASYFFLTAVFFFAGARFFATLLVVFFSTTGASSTACILG